MAIVYGHFKFADYLRARDADVKSTHIHCHEQRPDDSSLLEVLTLLGYLIASVEPEGRSPPRRGDMVRYVLNTDLECLVCPSLKAQAECISLGLEAMSRNE